MRKVLLGTTALVGASVVATSALAVPLQSHNEDGVPVLTASIVAQFEAGIASNDNNAGSANTRDGSFQNGRFAELQFDGEKTADNGLVYGASIHFSTSNTQTNAFPGREYMYMSGGWGKVELGQWVGADSGMNICVTCRTYAGYGALDAPWKSYIINPTAPTAATGKRYRNASVNSRWWDQAIGVTYYTPIVSGFQAGIGYQPKGGTGASTNADNDGNYNDILNFGAQWNGDFGDVGLALSAVGVVSDGFLSVTTGTVGLANQKDTTGLGIWEIGAKLSFGAFQVGGSYWDDGNSGAIKGRDFGFKSTGYTLEAAYFAGAFSAEVQWASTQVDSSSRVITAAVAQSGATASTGGAAFTDSYDTDMWAVSAGYQVAPGLKWYTEVVGADFDFGQSAADVTANGAVTNLENDAIAVLSGFVLSF